MASPTRRPRRIRAFDLFCGAGGTSTGLSTAARELGCQLDLVALNHWAVAIDTHSANHPEARHYCAPIEAVRPEDAFPGGVVDLGVGSPECTHHSPARGGKPINDQKRAGPWDMLKWVTRLRVKKLLIENVPAFEKWGPVNAQGRPIKRLAGTYFKAWIGALEAAGYTVAWKVLNAADYGDPTNRRRLFVQACLTKGPITWPAPTHSEGGKVPGTLAYRTARECVDLDHKGRIVTFEDLAHNTWQRAYRGLFENVHPLLWGLVLDWSHRYTQATGRHLKRPRAIRGKWRAAYGKFLVHYQGTGTAVDLGQLVPAITASGEHLALIEPFLQFLTHHGERASQSLDEAAPGVTGANRGELALLEAFLSQYNGSSESVPDRNPSLDAAIPNLTTSSMLALFEAFLVARHKENASQLPRIHDLKAPMPVVHTGGGPDLVEPVLLGQHGGAEPRGLDDTVNTVACGGAIGLAQPFILPPRGAQGGIDSNVPRTLQDLFQAILAERGGGHLLEPFLDQYNRTGGPRGLGELFNTATTKDRWGLVQAVVEYVMDRFQLGIRYRMLEPRELARAQGFPDSYVFKGGRTAVIKQIGNAVPVGLATALVRHILDPGTPPHKSVPRTPDQEAFLAEEIESEVEAEA